MFLQVSVCPRGKGLPQCMLGDPPCQGEPPLTGRPPSARETPLQAHTKGGKLRGIRSRPTAKGEIEGDQIQAHTQGGNSGGFRSRPTPKGEIQEDQIQVHTQGGNSGESDPGPHPRGKFRGIRPRPTSKGEIQGDQDQTPPPEQLLLRAVRILLECILVLVFSTIPTLNYNECNKLIPAVPD